MADWTPANGTIISRTLVTHGHATDGVVVGTGVDVSAWDRVNLHFRWCGLEAVSNTNPGFWMVLGSQTTNDAKHSLIDKIETNAETPETEAVTSASEPGPIIELASTTNFVQGNGVYCRDVATEANSSFRTIVGMVTNTSITVESALDSTLQSSSSDVIWTPADVFAIPYDVASLQYLNVAFSHQGTVGANGIIEVLYSAATDFE